jgi:hypothetical protein
MSLRRDIRSTSPCAARNVLACRLISPQTSFANKYLKTDSRRILLVYKIQYRLPKIAREIDEAATGYWYVPRAKNLLWAILVQGVLNHRQLPAWLETYGRTISVEADFTQELLSLGVQKVRHVIREAVSEQKYKEQLDQRRLSFPNPPGLLRLEPYSEGLRERI